MAGIKGQQGGGGRRERSGRPQSRLLLSKEAARELDVIVKFRRLINPDLKSESLIEAWIHEHWQELDALFQEKAEQ